MHLNIGSRRITDPNTSIAKRKKYTKRGSNSEICIDLLIKESKNGTAKVRRCLGAPRGAQMENNNEN